MKTQRFVPASLLAAVISVSSAAEPIDREAVLGRNSPVLEQPDKLSPFGVGLPGADFVFTADITGLQTLVDFHRPGQDLNIMAGWAWHEFPNPENFTLEDCTSPHPHDGETRPYSPMNPPEGLDEKKAERWLKASAWLRSNPHRFGLGRLGFVRPDGRPIAPEDLSNHHQKLDLWSGVLESRFTFEGSEVRVTTVPAAEPEGVSVRIRSSLLDQGKIALSLDFPGASDEWGGTSDDSAPERHKSEAKVTGDHEVRIDRTLDATKYAAALTWTGDATFNTAGPHRFQLTPRRSEQVDLRLSFSKNAITATVAPSFDEDVERCRSQWIGFWKQGGIVDFAGSTDPRASELERRVLLSRYLTAIHCSGENPPQETGNARNSWFGKFHLEMIVWHSAQFAMWGHPGILDKQLDYYRRILPMARATAAAQGCSGARWPKMTDPSGRESPSDIGVYLVWQQPHPIYLVDLVRRANPDKEVLVRHRDIVFATADFMASFLRRGEDGKLHLLPPLIPAQECYKWDETKNPAYELAYFRWALGKAREWRAELGEEPDAAWEAAWRDLAPLPVVEDRYATVEGPPYTLYHDHPCVLMVCGWLPPSDTLDMARFGRTFDDIAKKWEYPTTWGWDPPVMAMAAAKLGRPADAVSELLRDTPKNKYLPNGHNHLDDRLPLYLPGNGGLLHAVAAMVAGWDGAPDRPNPGFPDDGSWKIRSEGLLPAP